MLGLDPGLEAKMFGIGLRLESQVPSLGLGLPVHIFFSFLFIVSALEVFLNGMRYINARFTYLLTYLLFATIIMVNKDFQFPVFYDQPSDPTYGGPDFSCTTARRKSRWTVIGPDDLSCAAFRRLHRHACRYTTDGPKLIDNLMTHEQSYSQLTHQNRNSNDSVYMTK